jgi:hypothetical protein
LSYLVQLGNLSIEVTPTSGAHWPNDIALVRSGDQTGPT